MKLLLLLLLSISTVLCTVAQSVSINEVGGWFEAAWVEWTPPAETVQRYNVYYSGNGATDVQIDDQLIRSYGNHWRADVPGLAAGTYTLKVVPVIAGSERDVATTSPINVMAHDRSGFAFSNGVVPGAYKADGTPKDGAVIIYITENTKNNVSIDITGATTNPCVGFQTILDGIKKGNDDRPFIFRMVGEISDLDYMLGGDIVIENKNNTNSYITLEGIGEDATANGWGIRLKNANNIEIRNIATMNCNSTEGDNIGLQQNNFHIWVHNVDFFYGDAGSDSDQAKGDGALDAKKSSYVTISYNHFWDSGKSNLLGNGGEDVGNFTYHHNWYDHSDSRHPRVRQHTVHVYNNYFDGISKYGIGNTTAGSIFAENNYFRNCKYPMLISKQGTDVYGSNQGTFSGDPGGIIKAFGNYMIGETRFVDQNSFSNDFDAYVVENRNDVVPSSTTTTSGGHTYNNFDTDASMYSYTPQTAEDAKNSCIQYAGRMNGGDFQWTFDNDIEDTNYDVIPELKAALVAYSTSLVYIQNEGNPPVLSPVAEITSPDAGTSYNIGETISITASATDPDGSVVNVEFFVEINGVATSISTDNSDPYTASWIPSEAGVFNLYAIATDDAENTGSSASSYAITIYDPNVNNPPHITSLTSNKQEYIEGEDAIITAVATDDNAVARVEFYNGNVLLATITESPYVYSMPSLALGEYTITATVYDAENLSASTNCSFSVIELNESDLVHNFTENGLSSTFFSITGNLSDSKGEETYNGLILTQCLKIESSTNITFTTATESELVLVFNINPANTTFDGSIFINGISHTATDGILIVSLPAGNHTITKDDSANLYYMSITYTGDSNFTLTVNQSTGGSISLTGGEFADGENVSIEATASTGFIFSHWTGSLSGSENPTTVVMDGDKTVSAVFVAENGSILLNAGWNLVGCPIEGSTALETTLASIWDKVEIVKNNNGYFIKNQEEFLNSLNSMEWGQGYLVKVSEACSLEW
jgi:pectate lyase